MEIPRLAGCSRDMRGDGDIARAKALDDEACARRLDLLYRSHAGRLKQRIRAEVGSSDEASDLVQEAFSRLAGSALGGQVLQPAAFLNRIVRNLLIDRRRRASARPPHVALEPDTDVPVRADQADALEYEQMKARYRAIVESLPPRTREVFLLHRMDELSYRAIAERLDIGVRTVEWHIAEAIVRIAKELDAK
jgi:RNA polymerase sigma-70 factor (ECF subfamily)